MFREHVNKVELAQVAIEFKRLLVTYAEKLPAARNVLDRSSPLMQKAIDGQIELRNDKGYFPEEFWESGPLYEVEDLSETCAQFSLLLKGAESLERIRAGVRAIEEQAESDEEDVRGKGA